MNKCIPSAIMVGVRWLKVFLTDFNLTVTEGSAFMPVIIILKANFSEAGSSKWLTTETTGKSDKMDHNF